MELVKFENIGGSSVIATTSLRIAEFTGKEHYNVIRDIETLVKSGELCALNFELSNYKTSQGKLMPLYLLDETFTTILLMGFTGKEAIKWEIEYAKAFQTTREGLKAQPKTVERQKGNALSVADKMTKVVVAGKLSFVKPTPKDELGGELGLTLHEIAESLNIEFRDAKVKIESMIAAQRISYVVYSTYNKNNRLVDSYILDVNNSKFFVAKYDNEIGDSYTKFLISCESKLQNVIPRKKGDELSIADKMLKAVACAQRESLEGKTGHTGYCVQISRRVNELALGHHETGMRQKLTSEQVAAVNKVALDVVKEAMKGNLNPSNVAKTLATKYLEEAKYKEAKKGLKASSKEFKGKVRENGQWVEATLLIKDRS